MKLDTKNLSPAGKKAFTAFQNALQEIDNKVVAAAAAWCAIPTVDQVILIELEPRLRLMGEKLDLIHSKRLHPALYLMGSRASRLIQGTPLEEQEDLVRSPVSIVQGNRLVEYNILHAPEPVIRQAVEVNGNSIHIRTPREQKAYIEEKKKEKEDVEIIETKRFERRATNADLKLQYWKISGGVVIPQKKSMSVEEAHEACLEYMKTWKKLVHTI